MQKMTATKTRTGQENVHLSALPQAGRPNSSSAAPGAWSAPLEVSFPHRFSLAESYDGEIREAIRSPFVPVEPANSRPLRVKTRWILKNGISRRTLHVTVLFGIVGIVHYGVSLIPPFEGLRYQEESKVNNRQTMAYAVLRQCAARKLQNLPLGRDCRKYLAITPKAPPDIDIWMVDPPVSDSKKIRLLIRNIFLGAKKVFSESSDMQDSTVPRYDGSATDPLAGHGLAFVMVSLALIYIFHPQLKHLLGEMFCVSILPSTIRSLRRPTPTIPIYQWVSWILMLGFAVLIFVFLHQVLFYKPTGWAATSQFLATCKALEYSKLPFGPDCTKYLSMQLKPDPNEHTRSLDIDIDSIFGIALALGILVPLLAILALSGVKREILSNEHWSFNYEPHIFT